MAREYQKLEIYHLAYDFVLGIYKKTEKFPKNEEQNITSQLKRASVSIPLNIAEGSSRNSKKVFLNFLTYSYGSAKEVEVLLNLSADLKFINEKEFDYLFEKLDTLMAKLFLFIRNLEKDIPGNKYNFFQKFENRTKR